MKKPLLLILFIIFSFARAQTLYWVGGSGNFNDPKHWSYSSGGVTANVIPGANSDVIFDNNSGAGSVTINAEGINYAKSLRFNNDFLPIILSGNKSSELHLHGDFDLNNKVGLNYSGRLFFNSGSSSFHKVRFNNQFNGDVIFNNGSWDLMHVNVGKNNSIEFISGNYRIHNSTVRAGNLKAGDQVNFDVKSGIIDVEDEITLASNTKFSSDKLYLKAEKSNPLKYHVPANFNYGNNYKLLNSSNTSVVCGATLTSVGISCSGVCDGKLILDIDVSCAPSPFTLLWSNPSCTTPTLTGVGPGTYTVTGLCACPDFYSVIVFDGIGNILAISNATNIAGQSAINFIPVGFVQPTCNGLCNGSITSNLSGSTPPYTVTVNGSGTFAVPTGNTTYTNLCAGVNTFVVVDSKGCLKTQTVTLVQPAPLVTNSVLTNVSCFGACNGSLTISPTGGTANYTVNFSTGASFTLAAGGTASVTNRCPGVISATVTDSKGCTAIASGNITQPSLVTVVASQTNVSCFGLCNGTASVSVSGGVTPYTYTWSPASSNTNVATGLCAGTQTVTIQNNGGLCTNTQTFNITQPTSITITPTITQIPCPGGCNGSATVSATGGAGGITFTWTPPSPGTPSTGVSISNQCAGVYTVVGKDVNTCTNSAVVTLTAPPAYTVTSTTQTLTCFGSCAGAASVEVSGANGPPYSFTWTPATASTVVNGTTTASNLCAGNYTVSIKDGTCSATPVVVTITQPTSITLNATTTSLTCNGVCNGQISVAPTGGAAPYTYTLLTPTGGTIVAAPPFTGLCAGIHTVIVADQVPCTQSFTTNILQPNPLVPSVSSTSVSCFGGCNGVLSGNIGGGVPGYTLAWNTPTGTVNGGIISGICANVTHTFIATDFNGCVATLTASVNQPSSAISATINATNPLCNLTCNGVLNAVVAGGTPGYTLQWSNGFTGNPNTGLCAGNYTLMITDSKGCQSPFTATLTSPPAIALTQTVTNPACSGQASGSATVVATGGTGIITYQLNSPITTNTTGIFTGLGAGNYIVSATDANGCSQSTNFSLTNPPALTPALTGLVSSCNACTGGATVTPAGGTPGYTVTWVNSASVTVGTGTAVSGLCPGNHTATVMDANGCVATVTAGVVQTVSVTVVTGGTGIQCFGACTGSAVANPLGGTAPYSYSWSPTAPTQTNQTATSLCANSYSVLVTDFLGCFNTGTITLVNPPLLTVTATQTNVTCFGQCNGIISVTATGGTGPKTFSWSPGGQTTTSITGVCAGVYTLTVKDLNNCTDISTYTITENNNITATFTTTQPTGCGATNGSICATPSGGSGAGYTYTWSPTAGNASCLTGLSAGVYSLVIADGAGCTTTLSTLLTNPSGPTLSINTGSVNCFGGSTGSATIAMSGLAPFQYTFTPASVGFTQLGNTVTATGLISGTYAIAVMQSNSCVTTQSFNITQAPSFTVNSSITNPKCFGACNGSITLSTLGGTPSYTFAWISGTVTGQGTQTVTNLCAGQYTVSITDANSCVNTQTFNLTNPALLTLTNTATNVKCFGACNGSIVATAAGGTAPLSYTWTPLPPFSGSTTATVLNLCPGVYTVTAVDGNSCTATNTINITEPSQLTSTLTSVNASCSNSCNATATITGSGGTPTYSFSWSGSGAVTPSVGGLCAGSYSGTVIDANGCTSVQAFTISAPSPFTATLTPTSPLCNAVCNGSISTVLSGSQGTVSFNWVPSGTGQNPTSLCANNYTLTATDAAGCQLSSVTTLTNPPAILANITTTNPACNGNCNGIALSTPTNVSGTVSYSWTPTGPPTQTTQSASGLCAGNYTLTIQDGNGCQAIQTFTLNNPAPLNINTSIAPATCSLNNGSITALPSGGTPAYSFTWIPSVSTGSVATGLGANIYTIIVVDNNNCTNSVTVPLSNSNGPSSSPVTSSSINCFGQCTGAASVNPTGIVGGTSPYTISWVSPPSSTTVNPQTNLCAGDYTAQVTDGNNCILFTGVSITQPASVTVNSSIGLPTCNGVCNGTVGVTLSGGTPSYTYNWSPPGANSPTITNVCAGTVTLQIMDGNGCPATQTINVPAAANLAASITSATNICFGDCNGTATLTALPPFALPVNASWSNGQNSFNASSLCNGTYSVILTDGNGCNNTFTTTIASPAQITAITSVLSPSCNMCNGSTTATASGGTGPYTYSWTSGTSGQTATNLCAGLYQVLITDNNGCTQTQNVAISSATGITGENFNIQNETCAGMCNGAATVTAIGGTAPITYTWMTIPSITNSVATNLCSGPVFVQMSDSAGCIRTSSTSISSAPGLTIAPFITQPACGTSNGSITVVASGGTGSYTYLWSPGASTSSVLTNVGPGNYSVTVSSGGCSNTQAFTISNFGNPSITYTQTNIDCFSACTGSIIAIGTSTNAGSILYNWSSGSTNSVVTNICPGVITLTVTDGVGCIALQSFTLTDNPAMQLSASNVVNVKCFGDCDGEITLIPSGGTLPYTFTWSPSGTSNPQFSLCAGSYSATVIDAKGCSITTTAAITGPSASLTAVTSSVINSSCSSIADGSASVTINGGTPSYTYNWTGNPTFTATTQNLSGVLAGTYTLDVVDQNSCTATLSLEIIPTVTIDANAGPDSTFCTNSSIVLNGANSVGANGGYTWYSITSTGSLVIANSPTVNVTPATGSSTFVLIAVSSVSTCADTDVVVINSLPLPDVDAGPTFTIPMFTGVTIGGSPTSVSGITFSWSPPFDLSDPSIPNPVANNTVNTTYTITVIDANGCRASDTMQVLIYPEIKIPNGFSPNGDYKNDTWIIDNIYQFPDCVVEVYNRWGELLFMSTGYTTPFDGRYNGKRLPVGTYYYVINLNHPAYTKPYTGPLTIFR